MPDWADGLDALTFDGESVVASVPVGDGRVVVTTHRVLTYDPNGEVRFRAVDRPNVTGARVDTSGRADFLALAVRPALWGAVLLVAGLLLPLDDLLAPPDVPAGTGVDGLVSTVESVFGLVGLLDDLLLVAGVVLLLVAAVPASLYYLRRRQELVVAVAGDDDVRLPAPDADEAAAAATRVEAAARPGGAMDGSGDSGVGRSDADGTEPPTDDSDRTVEEAEDGE